MGAKSSTSVVADRLRFDYICLLYTWSTLVAAVIVVHLAQDVEKDRLYGARLENQAAVAKSNGTPWECVYLQVDAANQSNFATPMGASQAHGVDDRCGWTSYHPQKT